MWYLAIPGMMMELLYYGPATGGGLAAALFAGLALL